jgi:hypothetical protein
MKTVNKSQNTTKERRINKSIYLKNSELYRLSVLNVLYKMCTKAR